MEKGSDGVLLSARGIVKNYGHVRALDGFDVGLVGWVDHGWDNESDKETDFRPL